MFLARTPGAMFSALRPGAIYAARCLARTPALPGTPLLGLPLHWGLIAHINVLLLGEPPALTDGASNPNVLLSNVLWGELMASSPDIASLSAARPMGGGRGILLPHLLLIETGDWLFGLRYGAEPRNHN